MPSRRSARRGQFEADSAMSECERAYIRLSSGRSRHLDQAVRTLVQEMAHLQAAADASGLARARGSRSDPSARPRACHESSQPLQSAPSSTMPLPDSRRADDIAIQAEASYYGAVPVADATPQVQRPPRAKPGPSRRSRPRPPSLGGLRGLEGELRRRADAARARSVPLRGGGEPVGTADHDRRSLFTDASSRSQAISAAAEAEARSSGRGAASHRRSRVRQHAGGAIGGPAA